MTAVKQVAWEQSGKKIVIEIDESGLFGIRINGRFTGHQAAICPPAPKDRALFAQRGAVGMLGSIVIYKERATELLALQKEMESAPKPVNPLDELLRLESGLNEAREEVLAHYENPAYAYAQKEQATKALAERIFAHQDIYRAEVARRRAEEEKRRGEPLGEDIWNY